MNIMLVPFKNLLKNFLSTEVVVPDIMRIEGETAQGYLINNDSIRFTFEVFDKFNTPFNYNAFSFILDSDVPVIFNALSGPQSFTLSDHYHIIPIPFVDTDNNQPQKYLHIMYDNHDTSFTYYNGSPFEFRVDFDGLPAGTHYLSNLMLGKVIELPIESQFSMNVKYNNNVLENFSGMNLEDFTNNYYNFRLLFRDPPFTANYSKNLNTISTIDMVFEDMEIDPNLPKTNTPVLLVKDNTSFKLLYTNSISKEYLKHDRYNFKMSFTTLSTPYKI